MQSWKQVRVRIKGTEPWERGRFMIRIWRRQLVTLGSTWDGKKAEGRQLAVTWGRKTSFSETEF